MKGTLAVISLNINNFLESQQITNNSRMNEMKNVIFRKTLINNVTTGTISSDLSRLPSMNIIVRFSF